MDAVDYRELGSEKFAQGDYQEAVVAFEQAVKIDPNYSEAYRGLGGSYLNLGNYKTAIDYLDKAIEINSQDEKAFQNRGLSYHNLDNYLKAIENFSNAIEIKIDYWKAYYARGQSYFSLEKHQEAIVDFTKAIELGFEDPSPFYLRGLSKQSLDDVQGAIEDFTKAIELDPKNYKYYEARGHSYLYLGIMPAGADFEKLALLSSLNGDVKVAQYAEKVSEWMKSFPVEGSEPISSNTNTSSKGVSKTVNDTSFVVKVTGIKDGVKHTNEFVSPRANTRFVAVEILIDNTENDEYFVCNENYFPVKDIEGYQYECSLHNAIEPSLASDDIDSGDLSRGWITYEIPYNVSVENLRIRYEFGSCKTSWIKFSEMEKSIIRE